MKKLIYYFFILLVIGCSPEKTAIRTTPTQAELEFRSGPKSIPVVNTKTANTYLVDMLLENPGVSPPNSIRELRYPSELTSEELFAKSKVQFDQFLPSALISKQPEILGEIEVVTYYLLEFYMLTEPGNGKKVEYYLDVLMKLPHASDLEMIAKAYKYSLGELNPALGKKVEKYLNLQIDSFQKLTPKDGYSVDYIQAHNQEANKAIAVLNSDSD